MSKGDERARAYLAGEEIAFDEAQELWKRLKKAGDLSAARAVLERIREGEGLLDRVPARQKQELCRQAALLTSKDVELNAGVRHDRALEILSDEFDLDHEDLDGDAETLGIAGGIHKRRWLDLGQLEDLQKAAALYSRGAGDDLGHDAFAHSHPLCR